MSRAKYSDEFRTNASQEYVDEIGYLTLIGWNNAYRIHEISAFCHKKNRNYTKEFKKKCVKAIINDEGFVNKIIAQHGISNCSILIRWINVYNANRELNDYVPKHEIYMAKSR